MQRGEVTAAGHVHAVARMMSAARPGSAVLACPAEIRNLRRNRGPRVEVWLAPEPTTSGVLGWAEAFDQDKPVTVILFGLWSTGSVGVRVIGDVPRGPNIVVCGWVIGTTPAEPLAPDDERVITLDELRDLEQSAGQVHA